MEKNYIINTWALVRRGELSVIPETFDIHPDFLQNLSREDFEAAFRQIGDMFFQIMTDISKNPEHFAMPLFDEKTTRYGAPEAQESRFAAWRPMELLYTVFINGSLNKNSFLVDIPAFKKANKIKNVHLLFNALNDYGFVFSGLTGNKITPKTMEFFIEYPDNSNVITVMSQVAKKAADVIKIYPSYGVNRNNPFFRWSFRLLSEPFGVFSYNDPFYAVYDKSRTHEEREFISSFHQTIKEAGYFYQSGGGNEGPGIRYYDTESLMKRKGPYLFQLWDNKGDLQLHIRIRNAEKCIAYYYDKVMPQEISDMFRHSEPGCGNHAKGTCDMGIEYIFEDVTRWHCGCCSCLFWLRPKAENIDQYIKLLEVGGKK